MVFNKGFIYILIRVIVLVSLSIGLVYSYFQTDLVVTPIMFGVFILIAAIESAWHLQRQERSWIRFLQSVRYQDFNRVYQHQASRQLSEAYELIAKSMEELRTNSQAEFRLLQTVLGHISIGVACYRDDGDVIFTNKAFDTLLDLPGLAHIDRLKKSYPKIHEVITLPNGELVEWIDHMSGQKLFVRTEVFKLKERRHKLVSLADIRSPLDAKEMESYQKLMRVMTHEIMNSTTPILSLIRVVNAKIINGEELVTLDKKDQRNITISLKAIEARTAGILKFVEAYKEINKSLVPNYEDVPGKALMTEVQALMDPLSSPKMIVEDQLHKALYVDRSLISQVLINLIKNATEAMNSMENGKIAVNMREEAEFVVIEVADNGPGVPKKAIHQLFVPFYTTKPEGSGVGLALSRKIVKAHRGTLEYTTRPHKTVFTIRLPMRKE